MYLVHNFKLFENNVVFKYWIPKILYNVYNVYQLLSNCHNNLISNTNDLWFEWPVGGDYVFTYKKHR